jgi:hypothetical protein
MLLLSATSVFSKMDEWGYDLTNPKVTVISYRNNNGMSHASLHKTAM